MCYFLTIGAEAPAWRLAALLMDRLEIDLEAALEPASIRAAFPHEDDVRRVTHRGCSCDLVVRPAPREFPRSSVSLTGPCRRAIARAVADFGALRLLVRANQDASVPARPLAMALDEFRLADRELPTDRIIEVAREPR
jgi:hypothetical protein